MMAGRGKLKPKAKGKSPVREPPLPARSPIDEGMRSQMFNLSPGLSNRRRSDVELLPGLPDKTPRKKKDKSPLPKDPITKDGTVQVPGLVSFIEKCVDERHQSNHFGEPPLKEHRELPSEEDQNKSIESSSTQTGAKGLYAMDQSIGSSSSQEGNRSLNDKESESWLSNKKALFDESPNELKKWVIYLMRMKMTRA